MLGKPREFLKTLNCSVAFNMFTNVPKTHKDKLFFIDLFQLTLFVFVVSPPFARLRISAGIGPSQAL
jgi:hypothetical protein